MDFRLDDDQLELQRGIRSFCEGRVTFECLQSLESSGGFDAALWHELAEMGLLWLRQPEDAGGAGLGVVESAIAYAELGRRLVPGPLVWTHLAAPVVEGAGTGEVVVGGLDLSQAPGGPVLIEHLPSLDVLLVLHPDRVERIDPSTLDATPVDTPLDPLTPLHHVGALPPGERVGGVVQVGRVRLEGAAFAAAQLFGIAEASLELALAYSKVREQFGRAIGSFQAIKHILADMLVHKEIARAAVYAAAATLDDPESGDVARAVSTAKLFAGEAALRNARASIQVHGGMGYTWEHQAHYYLKRAWVLESSFGTRTEHSERIAERVFSAA